MISCLPVFWSWVQYQDNIQWNVHLMERGVSSVYYKTILSMTDTVWLMVCAKPSI
jgi:hypothetical protein